MPCEPNQPNRQPCQSCPNPNDFVDIPQGFGLTRIVREALQTNKELTQCLADFCGLGGEIGIGTGTDEDGGPFDVVDNNDGTLTVTDQTSNQSFTLDLKTVLEHLDFSELSTEQITDLVDTLDFEQLNAEQCGDIFQCIRDNGTQAEFDDLCSKFGVILNVSTGTDSSTANATQTAGVGCKENLHIFSPDNSVLINVTEGSAIVGLQLNPATLDGAAFVQNNTGSNIPETLTDPTVAVPGGFKSGDIVKQPYDDGVVCSVFDGTNWINLRAASPDMFGEVTTLTTGSLTTTNGVVINASQQYVVFPDGTTWASRNNATTFLTSNAVYDLTSFPPAGPVNPPTDPTSGDTVIQRFQNGLGYFTYNGTSWDLNLFETDDDQRFTCRDETGQDYVQGSLAGPQNPPANPSQADTHLEVYDNAAVIFNFQESGPAAGWDGNNICFIPLGGSGISSDTGNVLTLGSDGLPFFAEPTAFKSVILEVSNGAGANTGVAETTFTPTETTDYIFEYSGDVQQNTGGMSVGTTVGGTDLFVADPVSGDADGSRLTLTRQDNFTPPIPLTAGVTYHITQWAGGSGIIFNHTVCANAVQVDRFGPSTDANNVLTTVTDGLAFYNPNVLNLVKGSATNTTGTTPANAGEVIQFEFTVPEDDTYTITESLDSIVGGVPAQHGVV